MSDRLAAQRRLRLESSSDALEAISCGAGGLVFELSDLGSDFFDLKNGVAGDVFQKFVNYGFRAAFVVPGDHDLGDRVTELMRDHRGHPNVRFFETVDAGLLWLEQELDPDEPDAAAQ